MPGLIRLVGSETDPLHRKVRNGVAAAIEAGSFGWGEPLPSSRRLAAELGVSRNTVNAAYTALTTEGFLEPIPRVGHVVNAELHRQLDLRQTRTGAFDWTDRLVDTRPGLPVSERPRDWRRHPYPFVVGQQAVDSRTAADLGRAMRQALGEANRSVSLDDLIDTDDPLLVEMIRRHLLPARGVSARPEEILVTLGSQHGIHLVASSLRRGTVGVEEPGYPDMRQIFHRAGWRLRPIPVDEQGLVVPDRLTGLTAVFVTPSHHYPTNVTLSIGRRLALLERAGQTILIEDDYDAEFRYRGTHTPALKALDTDGRVIYLGSFSKFLAPGLRLGYVVADPALIETMRDVRRYMLRHPPGIVSRGIALMIRNGDYARSVTRTRRAMRTRWEILTTEVRDRLGIDADFPTGGVSLWVKGPSDLDCRRLATEAQKQGVVIERADYTYLTQPPPLNQFRLGFSAIETERIPEGISRLAPLIGR